MMPRSHDLNPAHIAAEAARRARRDAERQRILEAEARRPPRDRRIADVLAAARPPIAGLR